MAKIKKPKVAKPIKPKKPKLPKGPKGMGPKKAGKMPGGLAMPSPLDKKKKKFEDYLK